MSGSQGLRYPWNVAMIVRLTNAGILYAWARYLKDFILC